MSIDLLVMQVRNQNFLDQAQSKVGDVLGENLLEKMQMVFHLQEARFTERMRLKDHYLTLWENFKNHSVRIDKKNELRSRSSYINGRNPFLYPDLIIDRSKKIPKSLEEATDRFIEIFIDTHLCKSAIEESVKHPKKESNFRKKIKNFLSQCDRGGSHPFHSIKLVHEVYQDSLEITVDEAMKAVLNKDLSYSRER